MKKWLLGRQDKSTKQSYIWYSLGGLLNAGQSALLLIVISRTNPEADSGIYSIGYAIACLAGTIGLYGMRNFQVTDVTHRYSFSIYLKSRVISCIAMMMLVLYYILKGLMRLDYSVDKCAVILLLGLLKLVDAVEDVYHAKYQSVGRLDIAGRCMATRFMVMLLSFSVSLIFTGNRVVSSAISFISLKAICIAFYSDYIIGTHTISIFIFNNRSICIYTSIRITYKYFTMLKFINML